MLVSSALSVRNKMILYSEDKNQNIDWDEAVLVFERAPLGKQRREPNKLKRAFESSYSVVYVFDTDKLIGMGRALCDGEYQAAIYDMVVLPEYQGKGIGRNIIERLCEQLPVENIILYKMMCTAMAKLNQLMSESDSGYLE